MLQSENPNTNPVEIRETFMRDAHHELSNYSVSEDQIQVNFEHGQWWVTHLPTGAQWDVTDTQDSFCFEQVSEGSLEEWISEEYEVTIREQRLAAMDEDELRDCLTKLVVAVQDERNLLTALEIVKDWSLE